MRCRFCKSIAAVILTIPLYAFAVGVLTGPAKDPTPQTGTGNWVRSNNASMNSLTATGSLSSTGSTYLGSNNTQFDTTGHLGIITAPASAWGSSTAAVQLYPGASAVVFTNGSGNSGASFGENVYYDGSLYKFIASGYATMLREKQGAFDFYSSTASGTAGNTITWNSPSLSIAQDGTITGTGISGFTTASNTQTFTNKSISGSTNTLNNIGNSALTNSSVTVGSTSIALGATAATIAGLTLTSPTVTAISNNGSTKFSQASGNQTVQSSASTNGISAFQLQTGATARSTMMYDDASGYAALRTDGSYGQSQALYLISGGSLYLQSASGIVIDTNGVSFANAAPTISSCGTSPSVNSHSSNNSGRVTVGSVSATSCTITFATAFSTFNFCRVTAQTTLAGLSYSYTLSAITVSATGLTGDVIDYSCDGV